MESKSPSANPYLEARREWDERYGDALSRAHHWRLAAFAALSLAGVAVLGVAYVGSQSKIKPYVVAIDRMGDPIAMAQPVTGGAVAQRIIAAQVASWLWEARTVVPGTAAQKALLARVYAMLGERAAGIMNRWYQAHAPFSADGGTVNVQITSVLPVSPDTWQVNWTETVFQNGETRSTSVWKAEITTGRDVKLADTPQARLFNPLGIYIRNITWTRVLNES